MTKGDSPARARPVRPVPTLRFSSRGDSDTRVRLEEERGTIGRRADNTYVVQDPSVSRLHARIERYEDSVVLTDLGSTGGTKVNGEKIDGPHVLEHGDTITFGSAECSFEDPTAAGDGENETMVFEIAEVKTGTELSPRQQQVLELMAEGMTNIEIGEQLGITERTVKAYAQELYSKLEVSNRAGAVAEAAKQGLLDF